MSKQKYAVRKRWQLSDIDYQLLSIRDKNGNDIFLIDVEDKSNHY